MPYGITIYGGILGASIYHSGVTGIGADLGRLGSVSVDITAAETKFDDGRDDATGLSWRAQYAKDFPDTDTTVTLASYRYSTSQFYTFQKHLINVIHLMTRVFTVIDRQIIGVIVYKLIFHKILVVGARSTLTVINRIIGECMGPNAV